MTGAEFKESVTTRIRSVLWFQNHCHKVKGDTVALKRYTNELEALKTLVIAFNDEHNPQQVAFITYDKAGLIKGYALGEIMPE